MRYSELANCVKLPLLLGLLMLLPMAAVAMNQPTPAAIAGFNEYVAGVDARMGQQHRFDGSFLSPVDTARLHNGGLVIENITTGYGKSFPGALLHDWRGTAFVAGAKTADFEQILKDFNAYPREFSPQVLKTTVISRNGDRAVVRIRVRQHDGITVVMDTTYDVSFGQLDAQHGYSISRSTKVSELNGKGKPLGPKDEHGFLWRMNTYWSYAEGDGGLYIQLESVSLTRSIPTGLGWIVGPFVEKVPRNSMEFTLRSACNALRQRVNTAKAQSAGKAQR